MADFGGFQVKTPQEVLQELQATRMAISQIPDRQAKNSANIQFQLANLFGNPELRKAEALESNIKEAEKTVAEYGKGTPGSIDHQKFRLGQMYEAVKDQDPRAASQIMTQLTALDEAAFERKKVKAQEDRLEDANKRQNAESSHRLRWEDWKFTRDKNGKVTAHDPTDPESNARFQAAIEAGEMPLDQAQAAALPKKLRDSALAGQVNKSLFGKKTGEYAAQIKFMQKGARLLDVLAQFGEAGTLVADTQAKIAGLATEASGFVKAMRSNDGVPFNPELSRNFTESKVDQYIEKFGESQIPAGLSRAQFKSMVLNMGYVLARSLDSGGRLSDQDVNMAIEMLVGGTLDNGMINPQIMAGVMLNNATSQMDMLTGADAVVYTQERALAGDEQSKTVLALQRKLSEVYEDAFLRSAGRVLPEDRLQNVINPFPDDASEETAGNVGVLEDEGMPF